MGNFVFGGMEYKFVEKRVLFGMDYYYVLQNVITGAVLYLNCYPGG